MTDTTSTPPLTAPCKSAVSRIVWPALPSPEHAVVIALAHQLQDSQWWSEDSLRFQQMRQLEELLAHAKQTTPFYKDRFAALAGIRRGGLTLERFRGLPVATRAEVQEADTDMFAGPLPKGHGRTAESLTSGSTGRPVRIRQSSVNYLFFQAITLRFHEWHRRDYAAKSASIHWGGDPSGKRPGASWVPGYHSGPSVVFDYGRPIGEQIDWLLGEDPGYLQTYPSNLLELSRHCERHDLHLSGLREATSVGGVLDQSVRDECERIWGVPVTDAYSAREVGMIALQCPDHSHYHVQSESLLVEVLDGDGNPCQPGEIGRVVVTDLHNFAMPLVRYEIGDYAEVGAPCSCGRGLPVLTAIKGRTRNMLTMPDGTRFWTSFNSIALTNAVPAVRQAQLVQRRIDEVEARLVVANPISAEDGRRLLDILEAAVRHALTVRVVYVDDIQRSPTGKFEEVRSELHSGG